ncbi:MAG: hypothetical protein ABI131_01050 [Nostocoides sp.]
MDLSAALAADLTTLTEALDGADTDLAQTVQQLAVAAQGAVDSYLGLTITATTGGRQIHLTALQDSTQVGDIRTSLRVPLDAAGNHRADTHTPTGEAEAITGPGMELILYAGNPGALIDLAADLSWLTGRELAEFVLDAHLIVAEHSDELVRTSWVNQAIGVLIGRGYTPEHAAHQIDLLPTRTEQERRTSAERVHTGLRAPDPQLS